MSIKLEYILNKKYSFNRSSSSLIGTGGYSKVYLGKNNLDEDVAIKIINTQVLSPKEKQIIKGELDIVNIMKSDPHINIVTYYDYFETNNEMFIIMEYCKYGDLSNILKKPITEAKTQSLFCQIIMGMRHLNKLNIIHRDIKPENILINKDKILKITDFGFAKQTNDLAISMCGTPKFMAPEIGKQAYDDKVDVWSLGLLLYQMLFSINPFEGCLTKKDINEQLKQDIIIPPPNLIDKNVYKNISPICLDLLKNMLNIDPKNRISFQELFNNNWINEYDIDFNLYQSKIQAMSFGSLFNTITNMFGYTNQNNQNNQITPKNNLKYSGSLKKSTSIDKISNNTNHLNVSNNKIPSTNNKTSPINIKYTISHETSPNNDIFIIDDYFDKLDDLIKSKYDEEIFQFDG